MELNDSELFATAVRLLDESAEFLRTYTYGKRPDPEITNLLVRLDRDSAILRSGNFEVGKDRVLRIVDKEERTEKPAGSKGKHSGKNLPHPRRR